MSRGWFKSEYARKKLEYFVKDFEAFYIQQQWFCCSCESGEKKYIAMFVLTKSKVRIILIRFIICEGLVMMLNYATINTALLIIMKK